ncbi:MAG: flagellar hook capping FlgD N-terminal domain-containing protein, partial [Armatimonadota bacterium]
AASSTNRAELSAEDFWRLLLTHLQMQDPFQSADMNAMLEQFVTIQAAREMSRLSDALQRVQALLLLGRFVSAQWEGEELSGTVVSVSLSGSPILGIKVGDQTVAVPINSVWEVATEQTINFSTQA